MGVLHCLYCENYLSENWKLYVFQEVLSSEVVHFHRKSIIQSCKESVVMFGLVFPTGAWICYIINCKNSCAGLLVNVLLFVNLAYHQNVSSTNLFYSYYFERYLSEMTELIHLPYCDWRSSCYCNKFFIFPSPFVYVIRIPMWPVFFFIQLNLETLVCRIFCFDLWFKYLESRVSRCLFVFGLFLFKSYMACLFVSYASFIMFF